MNILFLTMGGFKGIEEHSLYPDLLRCFRNCGHEIYVISPNEKRTGKKTELIHENGAHILRIETGDVTSSSNLIKKGLAQLSIGTIYINAIRTQFSDVKFDLVLYSTPPITFVKAVEFVKKRDRATTYLLLKDIFPQNAIDIGLMTKDGLRGLIYKYFRAMEKRLYEASDYIGCMSEANVQYVLDHNPEIPSTKVDVCPNCVEPVDMSVDSDTRVAIREKYDIPLDEKVFVYGGNLGRPQCIPFVIECLRKCQDIEDAYFLIVGDGTEYHLLSEFVEAEKPTNVRLMKRLPKEDYDSMVGACDVGMIFLDHRFTIPNFPSRLLSYMQAKLPVLACTDPNTDIGKVIVDGGFGWWCESEDPEDFSSLVKAATLTDLGQLSEIEWNCLLNNYSAQQSYSIIINSMGKHNENFKYDCFL